MAMVQGQEPGCSQRGRARAELGPNCAEFESRAVGEGLIWRRLFRMSGTQAKGDCA